MSLFGHSHSYDDSYGILTTCELTDVHKSLFPYRRETKDLRSAALIHPTRVTRAAEQPVAGRGDNHIATY